jgi:DNA polymerase-3 subunit chi
MTEVLFYHLEHLTLESVLPKLLEKSVERGWRAVVQASSDERVDVIDAHLWTYRDDSFLPHGTARDRDSAEHPVLITTDGANRNGAKVRFLVDGAEVPEDAASYERVVLIFNGEDDDAVAAARAQWTQCKGKGFEVTYWQPDDAGRWQRKA